MEYVIKDFTIWLILSFSYFIFTVSSFNIQSKTVPLLSGTILGLCSMLLYYRFFHPTGPINPFVGESVDFVVDPDVERSPDFVIHDARYSIKKHAASTKIVFLNRRNFLKLKDFSSWSCFLILNLLTKSEHQKIKKPVFSFTNLFFRSFVWLL